MTILIPIIKTNETSDPIIADDFRSCNGYALYTDGKIVTIEHDENAQENALSAILTENNVSAVIAPKLMPMSLKIFSLKKIDCYRAVNSELQPNIQLFLNNQLKNYSAAESFTSSCGGKCSTCEESCQ